MDIRNCDATEMLTSLDDQTVDLILTDPPYMTSRPTGMDALATRVAAMAPNDTAKTETEWKEFSKGSEYTEEQKQNWIKYGTIYGKKYAVRTQYGDWDTEFTMAKLEEVLRLSHRKMRSGGTIIVWFDLWRVGELKDLLESVGFRMTRLVEWIKTNPQPLNSSSGYLTNCREVAVFGVKGKKPTFNSKYDNGLYQYPLMTGKHRKHPTQKSLDLFKALVAKHSNPNDLVVDPFLGAGTTARACKDLGRRCTGSELDPGYFKIASEWISL